MFEIKFEANKTFSLIGSEVTARLNHNWSDSNHYLRVAIKKNRSKGPVFIGLHEIAQG